MKSDNPEIKLPDATILYEYERAKEVFKQIESRKFTISDAILLLLFAQSDKPIHGRTSLMKQVFLVTHEVLPRNHVQDGKFVPLRYGMYSFNVANVVENLEFANYIKREGRKNTRNERFLISEKGGQYAARLFQTLPQELQTIMREKRKGWDQLGYDGILRYVYKRYPEYRDKSVLKKRYAPIVWGRGIG